MIRVRRFYLVLIFSLIGISGVSQSMVPFPPWLPENLLRNERGVKTITTKIYETGKDRIPGNRAPLYTNLTKYSDKGNLVSMESWDGNQELVGALYLMEGNGIQKDWRFFHDSINDRERSYRVDSNGFPVEYRLGSAFWEKYYWDEAGKLIEILKYQKKSWKEDGEIFGGYRYHYDDQGLLLSCQELQFGSPYPYRMNELVTEYVYTYKGDVIEVLVKHYGPIRYDQFLVLEYEEGLIRSSIHFIEKKYYDKGRGGRLVEYSYEFYE